MMPRRLLLLLVCAFLLFLGVYTWNQRTGRWDRLSSSVGLEISGSVMRALNGVDDAVTGLWETYVDLRGVKARNAELEQKVRQLEQRLAAPSEELAELAVRALDALLDYQDYPIEAARKASMKLSP